MNKLRVAIVGMGIGRPNGLALANNARADVVALCDLFEERMTDFAHLLPQPDQVRLFTDFDELCRSREIDAIFIGTPNQLHVPMGLKAVAHGKHLLVTKPLADSVEAAARLVEAAEAAGVVNMMSLSTRFSPDVQYMGALARQGTFGELYYARARSIRRNGIPAWNPGFIRAGGGAFRDMGVVAAGDAATVERNRRGRGEVRAAWVGLLRGQGTQPGVDRAAELLQPVCR